jgi:glycosyltransferase involved in cell wall biosynthesis
VPSFVAVIIPTFNRASLLDRAIRSVLNQTWRNFELVVVDDASTDGTADLPVIKSGNGRFRYLRLSENRGVSVARNAGIRATSAPWLAFLDSDDEWFPTKLSKQVEWAKKNPEFHICQTQELWIRRGIRVNPPKTHEKFGGDLFAASLNRCMITSSSVMLNRELFEAMGGFNEAFPACEDYDLWLRVTSHYQVGLVDEFLLKRYGGHGDQLSKTIPILDRFRVQSLVNLIENGVLTEFQRNLTIESAVKRAIILAQGYKKRGNIREYGKYREIIRHYDRSENNAGLAALFHGAADTVA